MRKIRRESFVESTGDGIRDKGRLPWVLCYRIGSETWVLDLWEQREKRFWLTWFMSYSGLGGIVHWDGGMG